MINLSMYQPENKEEYVRQWVVYYDVLKYDQHLSVQDHPSICSPIETQERWKP